MTFSDAVKNNTEAKYLKLLSGELDSPTTEMKFVSLDEYKAKRSEYHKRFEREQSAIENELQNLKVAKQLADENIRLEKERLEKECLEKERQEKERLRLEEEARLERERQEKEM